MHGLLSSCSDHWDDLRDISGANHLPRTGQSTSGDSDQNAYSFYLYTSGHHRLLFLHLLLLSPGYRGVQALSPSFAGKVELAL